MLVPPLNVDQRRLPPTLTYGLYSLQALAKDWGGDVEVLSFARPDFRARAFACSEEMVEAVVDLVDTDRHEIVGFSTMCGSFHHSIAAACSLVRRSPKTRVWLGGPNASIAPGPLLEAFSEIEAVFVGESEATFREVLSRREETADTPLAGIAGVCARNSPFVPRDLIADLDTLPYVDEAPGFADAAAESRGTGGGHALPLEAERGCPGRCSFCSTSSFWGRRVRKKTHSRVITEMHRLRASTGTTSFALIGDNAASPRAHLLALCAAMHEQAPDYQWICQLKVDQLEESDLEVLWQGGCRGFFVGVESASQDTLDRIHKGADLTKELRLIDAAVELGFRVITSFIVGFPWETKGDIERTLSLHADLLRRGVFYSMLSAVCPLPGTELARSTRGRLRKRAGISLTSSDGLPYGPETIKMMERCPELFSQLDYVENEAGWAEVAATTQAASMFAERHERARHKARQHAE
ncbi:MAG: B12-binding domain-containing radical SAM protein [Actinobacteria bacterium]|nr:B12-binding domain-containing radical SAM protein [Actinomycetota bacterium]